MSRELVNALRRRADPEGRVREWSGGDSLLMRKAASRIEELERCKAELWCTAAALCDCIDRGNDIRTSYAVDGMRAVLSRHAPARPQEPSMCDPRGDFSSEIQQ